MSDAKVYLNLGCGSRYHPDWLNIDLAPRHAGVMQHDLSRGIPLPQASCEVVYHAAVLEHLRRAQAKVFMGECHRVLKPGGIVRVGVPDLEKICRLYLAALAGALNREAGAAWDYDWLLLELFDQIGREQSGGDMLDYLRQDPVPNETFVYERLGAEGQQLVQALRQATGPGKEPVPSLAARLFKGLRTLPRQARRFLASSLLGPEDRRALEIGRFRLSGEVHHWMYDHYSLARLLEQAGFQEVMVQDARTSRIPRWDEFHLDTRPDGQVIKPDLFFMEAVKGEVHGRG